MCISDRTFNIAHAFNSELVWDTSKVTSMWYTFENAIAFNKPLAWDTSQVTDMVGTFNGAEAFNQPGISAWDVSKASLMTDMFAGSALASDECSKQELREAWKDVAAFTSAHDWSAAVCLPAGAFADRTKLKAAVDDFPTSESTHGSISGWDVSRVDDLSGCCYESSKGCDESCSGFFPVGFNGDISAWDSSSVTTMDSTFATDGSTMGSKFNQPLAWDTSQVTTMWDTV